jgi:hypothetical protein
MGVSYLRSPFMAAGLSVMIGAMAVCARGDEIRLKDGKKLYGVIVAYEDNMFKVKTDFGYVLVEKDKIASIVPTTPTASKNDPPPAAKKETAPTKPAMEPVSANSTEAGTPAMDAEVKHEKTSPKIVNAEVRPSMPMTSVRADATAPALKGPAAPSKSALATATPVPAAPKEPEAPANKEEIQGNLYINYSHGFRMYKAPSWQVIEDARKALPNAIVAMGTFNQSTLMVVGQERTKEPLNAAAATVEKRLQDVYDGYQRISERKTVVGGLPAIEYHYRGKADDHDWSGTLVVIARGTDIVTALGMTHADTDLIQIQENVIARAIASLDFTTH